MYKNKLLFLSLILLAGSMGCKKQLNVGNPNSPTIPQNVYNQTGLIAFAQGIVYEDGFAPSNAYNWLGSSYFSLNNGYSELLADNVSSDDANELVNTINTPAYVVLDDGTQYPATPNETNTQQLRVGNTRSSTAAGYNPFYYTWANMYILNGACNTLLSLIPTIKTTSADASNTVTAWGQFWKGYAYSIIATQYYAGIVNNVAGADNNNYLIKDSILAQSNYWYAQAQATLNLIPSGSTDYSTVMGGLLPTDFQQSTHGGLITTAMWGRIINTLLARNILENKLAPFVNGNLSSAITGSSISAMAASDWQSVLTLATNGIQLGDYMFTAVSLQENGIIGATSGSAALLTAGPNSNTVYKITPRFTEDFNAGDQRLALDFSTTNGTYYSSYFSTPYSLTNQPNGSGGTVYNYGDQTIGVYEVYIAGSYEENELILAEANLRLGNTGTGLGQIDLVRQYQGAGVPSVGGLSGNPSAAYNELVKERRVALFDRGISFWDARRWGWTYDISKGGGSYGNSMIYVPSSGSPVNNVNVTFDYDFLDYWDVPADEVQLNPPSAATAKVVVNPNF